MWWTDGKRTITNSRKIKYCGRKKCIHAYLFFIFYILGIVVLTFTTPGCSLFSSSSRSSEPPIFSKNPTTFKARDFKDIQKDLLQITENHPNPEIRRKALYHLAKTMAHYNNPSPRYNQALDYFKKYIKSGEGTPEGEDTRNWIAVLQSFKEQSQKISDLINQNSELTKTKKENQKTIQQLKQEITKLKNNIKRLDSLYLKMERKRRKKN